MNVNKAKLGFAMADKGMNFTTLAKESGVSRATLSYINNGKTCRPDVVNRIAKALKIPAEELIEPEVK